MLQFWDLLLRCFKEDEYVDLVYNIVKITTTTCASHDTVISMDNKSLPGRNIDEVHYALIDRGKDLFGVLGH